VFFFFFSAKSTIYHFGLKINNKCKQKISFRTGTVKGLLRLLAEEHDRLRLGPLIFLLDSD